MRLHISGNNKGTSLIELIIAMAIAAIVLSMIMFLINVSSNNFRRTSNEVNLQMESQTAINQISNLAMEAIEVTREVNGNIERYIFENSDADYYTIVFDATEMELYQIGPTGFEEAKVAAYNKEVNLLAEYVDNFEINIAVKSVNIILTSALGEDTFTVSKKVKLRNAK
ncbi:MAG TPA: prepilin-type N-terminal cleavage/methylation domain-containing protein [Mobilitalea sp.]|nr:prepilin-type N-terminal cleavage/methylation domain-containing protein [Mobilitalea sp.]